jgi:hypothetical protein
MPRIIFIILLIITGNNLFAQYLHYSDTRNINDKTSHAQTAPTTVPDTPPKVIKDTVRLVLKDTVKVMVRDTVKTVVHDTLRLMVRDTIEIVVHDTVNICPTNVVYHKWPDRCPGLSGSIPVVNNYIPPEMVLKLTEIYKGHLYSISSSRNAGNKMQYKLKVCENGVIKFEYADENGDIISGQLHGKN